MSAFSSKPRRVPIALFTMFSILCGLAIYSAIRFEKLGSQVSTDVPENTIWAAAQAEVELGRFLHALDAFSHQDQKSVLHPRGHHSFQGTANGDGARGVSIDKLHVRFAILWSRINLYTSGRIGRKIDEDPDHRSIVARMLIDLEALAPIVENIEPGDFPTAATIRQTLSPYTDELRKITLANLQSDLNERLAAAELHTKSREEFATFGILAIVAVIVLTLYLAYSERTARRLLADAIEARAAAADAENRLTDAIENINEGFILFDRDDRLVLCNEKYKEIYSNSSQGLIAGSSFEETVRFGVAANQYSIPHGEEQDWIKERLDTRKKLPSPFLQQLSDGRWLMVSDRQTKDGCIVGIRTDVTELKAREVELKQAQARLARQAAEMCELANDVQHSKTVLTDALESIREGFSLYDKDDRLVLCNSQYRAFFKSAEAPPQPGTHFKDIIRKLYERELLSCPDNSSIDTLVDQAVRRRRNNIDESYEELLSDGRWLRISNHRTTDDGVVTVFADITASKKRELEITTAHKRLSQQTIELRDLAEVAQEANRAKSEFLAMMSHEIRTPMNAIIGFSDLLSETELSPDQARFTHRIGAASHGLLVLINDLLDFSRLESGRMELEETGFNLRELVENAISIGEVLKASKPVEIVTDFPADLPDGVKGDPDRIYQVLVNLISNAVKFTDEGKIEISIRIEPSSTGPMLRFSVSDTGPGIPPELESRLFQPFEQGAVIKAQKLSGTGLGLAISKRLVDLMGGQIGIKEHDKFNTSFFFEIAFVKAELQTSDNQPATALEDESAAPRPLRILVAEDTPASQMVIKLMLEQLGNKVLIVADGNEAIKAANDAKYDLILMDMQMPCVGGLEATQRIRNLPPPACDVPIIALTAQALETNRKEAMDAGMNDYLTKPIRRKELVAMLSKHTVAKHTATEPVAGSGWSDTPLEVQEAAPGIIPDMSEEEGIIAINFSALDNIKEAVGEEVLERLLSRFKRNARLELDRLGEAISESDQANLRSISHKFVGLFSQFGFPGIAAMASAVENSEDDALQLQAENLHRLAHRALEKMTELMPEIV